MRSMSCSLVLLLAPVAAAGDGFVPLFNNKNLDGWEAREHSAGDKDKWSAQNGILVAKPGSGWIGTTSASSRRGG